MKHTINNTCKNLSVLMLLMLPAFVLAQDSTATASTSSKKEYVRGTFENAVLLNNQTVENTRKNSLDFMIQHRFGVIEDAKDLYGLYAPSNIRLGFTYGVIKWLSLGFGVTKDKMIYDFQAKANILRQTKDNSMPISLTYYGNMALSARADNNFLNQEGEYKLANKFTYFNEIMVARKFNSHFSLQLGATYSHMNLIDSVYGQHDFIGGSLVARYKFSPQSSLMLDFDYLFNVSGIDASVRPEPNMTIGWEISTGSHQFQIFVGTAKAIVSQEYRVYNQNQIDQLEFLLGFNITRIWDFK